MTFTESRWAFVREASPWLSKEHLCFWHHWPGGLTGVSLAVQTLTNCAWLYLLKKVRNLGRVLWGANEMKLWVLQLHTHTKGQFNHQSLSKWRQPPSPWSSPAGQPQVGRTPLKVYLLRSRDSLPAICYLQQGKWQFIWDLKHIVCKLAELLEV